MIQIERFPISREKIADLCQTYPQLKTLVSKSLGGEGFQCGPCFPSMLHIANKHLLPEYDHHPGIAGDLGLELLDQGTRMGIAATGFYITPYPSLTLVINHTAQGHPRSIFTSAARNRLVRSDFRIHLLQATVALARVYNFTAVKVISSLNHPKVYQLQPEEILERQLCQQIWDAGLITPEQGNKCIDQVVIDSGLPFVFDVDFNYHLLLQGDTL